MYVPVPRGRIVGNLSLGGTRPQTPAEGRLRPPDLLQTKLRVSISILGLGGISC